MADVKQTLTKKVGPAPLYVWAVVGIVGYYLFRHFSTTTQSAASTMTPSSVDTGTTSTGTGSTSAPASGGGSAADNFSSSQFASLLGGFVDVNSNLVTALNNSNNAIAGLGSEALGWNGQLEQAIINNWTSTTTSSSAGSTSGVPHGQPTPPAPPPAAPAPPPAPPPTTNYGGVTGPPIFAFK